MLVLLALWLCIFCSTSTVYTSHVDQFLNLDKYPNISFLFNRSGAYQSYEPSFFSTEYWKYLNVSKKFLVKKFLSFLTVPVSFLYAQKRNENIMHDDKKNDQKGTFFSKIRDFLSPVGKLREEQKCMLLEHQKKIEQFRKEFNRLKNGRDELLKKLKEKQKEEQDKISDIEKTETKLKEEINEEKNKVLVSIKEEIKKKSDEHMQEQKNGFDEIKKRFVENNKKVTEKPDAIFSELESLKSKIEQVKETFIKIIEQQVNENVEQQASKHQEKVNNAYKENSSNVKRIKNELKENKKLAGKTEINLNQLKGLKKEIDELWQLLIMEGVINNKIIEKYNNCEKNSSDLEKIQNELTKTQKLADITEINLNGLKKGMDEPLQLHNKQGNTPDRELVIKLNSGVFNSIRKNNFEEYLNQ